MRRHLALVQAAVLALTLAFAPHSTASAAPDCRAVADAMKEMERNIVRGWEQKNAGGQEAEALQSARSIVRAFTGMPPGAQTCLNGDGKMHLFVLVSKANVLIAVLNQSSTSIKKSNVSMAHDIVAAASPYRSANLIYWRAINEDAAKVQRRYADVARAEATAVAAKREAVLSVTHAHRSAAAAKSLATVDTKRRPARNKPSVAASGSSGSFSRPGACARPNVAATTLRAVEPDTPALSQQQGISGTVQVLVSLDADSKVVGARIQSSPSAILNHAALAAARQSTYQTEIRDCKPVAAEYIFSVEFSDQ